MKSITGYLFKSATGAITWASKKQDLVTLSSMHAETLAICASIREAHWLKTLVEKLEAKKLDPISMYCDNLSCIKTARNPVLHAASKHVEIWQHYIRENVSLGVVDIFLVSTRDQVADILTKPLDKSKFTKFKKKMGVFCLESLT
jgi:hypothetical protein